MGKSSNMGLKGTNYHGPGSGKGDTLLSGRYLGGTESAKRLVVEIERRTISKMSGPFTWDGCTGTIYNIRTVKVEGPENMGV